MKKYIKLGFIILISFLSGFSTNQAQSSEIIHLGNKSIITSPPDGYEDLENSDLLKIMQSFVPPTNIFQKGYITVKDNELVRNKTYPEFKDYLMLQTPKSLTEDISLQSFEKIRNVSRKNLESSLSDSNLVKKAENLINSNMESQFQYDANFQIGKPINLGLILDTKEAFCFQALTRYSMNVDNKDASYIVAVSNCILLLNNKVVFAYVFKGFTKKSDIQDAKQTGIEWAMQLIKLNPNDTSTHDSFSQNKNNNIEKIVEKGFIGGLSAGSFALIIALFFGALGLIKSIFKNKK